MNKRLFNDTVLELKTRIESYKENGFEYKSLEKSITALESKLDAKEDEQTHIITQIKKIKENKKEYRGVVASFVVALSIFTGISIVMPAAFYKPCHSRYIMDVEYYDTINGEIQKEENHRNDLLDGKTFVVEYSPWSETNDGFIRDNKKYDVSHIDYEELAEYLLLDLNRLGINYEEKEEHKDALTPEDLYEEPIYEVVDYNLNHISYVGPFDDADGSFAWLFCFLVLFSLGSLEMCAAIRFLKDELKVVKMNNKEYSREELGNDIKKLLDKYEATNRDITKIKNELLELYNKYKFLLNDKKIKNNYQRLVREK